MTDAEELELLRLRKRKAIGQQVAAAPPVQQEAPTLDATNTGLAHFVRHIALGAGDKIMAAEQAAGDLMADPSKRSWEGLKGAYSGNLAFNDRLLNASDEAHPVARWAGNLAGFGGSSLALGAPGFLSGGGEVAQALPRALALKASAKAGMKLGSIIGGIGGFGADRSDSTLGTVANTTLGGLLGAGAGAAAPYAADYIGRGAQWLGGKAQDLAGWLKVHSLHPNPSVAEAMADLPGGKVAVGQQLLDQGVGGLTKGGTAEQTSAAMKGAASAIDNVVSSHDAAGGAPIDLGAVFSDADTLAKQMQARPPTEDAGNKLGAWVEKYRKLYSAGPVKAEDALALKRELGKEAYKAGLALEKSGDTVAGHFGDALGKVERGVDTQLDKTVGPAFEEANLTFRRLLGANQAATRLAARGTSNHLLGLSPSVLTGGAVAAGHGGPQAAAVALGTTLAQKYVSQAGARILYSPVGGGLGLLGRGFQALPGAVSSGVAAEEAGPLTAGFMRPQTLGDLLMSLRSPAGQEYAQGGGQ